MQRGPFAMLKGGRAPAGYGWSARLPWQLRVLTLECALRYLETFVEGIQDSEEAARLFREAWPLLHRVSTLISAANMLAHAGGRPLRQCPLFPVHGCQRGHL